MYGSDFSKEMINIANERNIYKKIFFEDVNDTVRIESEYFSYIAAVGVISPTHADYKTIGKYFSVLKIGGLMTFSLNDHALNDIRYENEIQRLLKNNSAEILDSTYGDHLPKINLKSKIFVIKKNK